MSLMQDDDMPKPGRLNTPGTLMSSFMRCQHCNRRLTRIGPEIVICTVCDNADATIARPDWLDGE